jgi:hypothetical protein
MAVNVFPAPSTGPEVPQGLRPPKITYNQNWALTGLTGITEFDHACGNMMTYRKTDNSLYFVGRNSSGLYKFDLTTQTGSRVATNMTTSSKDIMAAQDGTLYRAHNLETGSAAEYASSSDGGLNWTQRDNSLSTDRGWITVIDNGFFPDVTGNILFVTRNSTQSFGSRMVVNNVNTSTLNSFQTETRPSDSISFDLRGGHGIFPLRDGDDNIAEGHFILDSTISTEFYGPSNNAATVYFRYANIGRRWNGTINNWQITYLAPDYVLNSTNIPQPMPIAPIGKPTSIQSRWIVGASRFGGAFAPSLFIHDYENNFARVGSTPLRIDSTASVTFNNQSFSNPIYIAATKKLYVMYARYSGGTGDARMYEYDVTTY